MLEKKEKNLHMPWDNIKQSNITSQEKRDGGKIFH
jgi:hypothetical protein